MFKLSKGQPFLPDAALFPSPSLIFALSLWGVAADWLKLYIYCKGFPIFLCAQSGASTFPTSPEGGNSTQLRLNLSVEGEQRRTAARSSAERQQGSECEEAARIATEAAEC